MDRISVFKLAVSLWMIGNLNWWIKQYFGELIADAELRNTGLERSETLKKDLEWFKEQGYTIPEGPQPYSSPGNSYARYLEELSEKNPPAFICHFYVVNFAHTAGGRKIGKKVSTYLSLF